MTDCCTSIKDLGCAYSCDAIQIGVNAPATGLYTLELMPEGIKVLQTTNTASSPLIFTGGYLNEDKTHVFKIIKPDGTYYETSAGEDCFKVTIKPSVDPTLANNNIVPVACDEATAVLKNTAGTTISTTAIASGASSDITAPDATAVVKDQDGNTLDTEAIPSNVSEDIVITLPRIVELYFAFEAGNDTSALATNSGTTWTLTAISDDGSSGTITVSDNGGAYGAFVNPTTIANAETIQVKRTTTTGAGWVLLTGTYS